MPALSQKVVVLLARTLNGILRNQSFRREESMPISFCDQINKKTNINQIINHEKAFMLNKDANEYFKHGYYMDAINNYKQALKLFISLYGEEHNAVAKTIGNVGNAYWKLGKLHEATARLQYSLRILRNISKKKN